MLDDVARNREAWKRVRRQVREGAPLGIDAWELEFARSASGMRMLHLFCGDGAEAAAWSDHGFEVVGVDFVATSGWFGRESRRDLAFVQADITSGIPLASGSLDIVWMSYCSIYWVPSISHLFREIARILRSGGLLIMKELHPASMCISTRGDTEPPIVVDYPCGPLPRRKQVGLGYTGVVHPMRPVVWVHGAGSIITALAASGIEVLEFGESLHASFRQFAYLENDDTGGFVAPSGYSAPPLSMRIAGRVRASWVRGQALS